MNRGLQGAYETTNVAGEEVKSFLPKPLPPDPPIDWAHDLREKFENAYWALGGLDKLSLWLPNIPLFQYIYVRQEAVLSSKIEGTQSSLSDLLLFELDEEPGAPLDDVQEVSDYVAALEYGISRLDSGFPLCSRLFSEIHGILLAKGRGERQHPGELRRSQNWIGGSRPGDAVFAPPRYSHVPECLGQLDLFLNDQISRTSGLLKAALAHVQFETIHPFLDGNGRLGRLLITLILIYCKILRAPTLYLSLYFKTHRQKYYDLLTLVRLTGDWEAWLDFFAESVTATASQAMETARNLLALSISDKEKIVALGRPASSALRVYQELLERPIATSAFLAKRTGFTQATVNQALGHLEKLNVVKEITSQKRNRIFLYFKRLDIYNHNIE
jgi:Fic family protein